jgi:serine/threonine protein kinase/tetratricopeptide (TPR) repeat protein
MPGLHQSFSEGELVAGNYRILGIAGSGGMGVVYRALDLRLERVVALKFLPPELNASPSDKERFLREARTASSLDHPNIGVVHGVEETADGRTFIIMAFYEGASLAEHIRRGPLPKPQAVAIAAQMARGLAEAHVRGIVHRDIKPSNVMLTASGLIKIVDFGLAHVVTAQTASIAGISGTMAYMSPEQALGHAVDHRCDIWALGVLLAEMLTGVHPFHGETIPSVLFNVLNAAPQNIGALDPSLQQVIYRALTKDAARRYPSCAEFLSDLESAGDASSVSDKLLANSSISDRRSAQIRRARAGASSSIWKPAASRRTPLTLASAFLLLVMIGIAVWLLPSLRRRVATVIAGAPRQKHIAVLPFESTGSNPENAALTDGLMDSLTGRLSNLDVGNQSLWMVPNSEVRRRKINNPADALKQLGANLVVKGSVERDGSDIHLTVNLIDTKTLRQIGSADVQSQAGDLSTLEDEAVSRLAQLMNLSVTAGMPHNGSIRSSPAAYEDYLTALGYMQRYDKPGNLELAITALSNSIKTDPQFALGYAQLGEAYRLRYQVDQNPAWLTEAEANCRKSIELDNRIPETYVTLGRIHDSTGKPDLALAEFQQALSLNARDAPALTGLAYAYEHAGRNADAEAAFQKAAVMRPDDWDGYDILGKYLQRQRRYSDAIAQYQHALQLTPDNAVVLANLAGTYADSGDARNLPLAESTLRHLIALSPNAGAYANLGYVLYQEHRYRDSVDATQQALTLNSADYLVWENLRDAFEWLQDASGAQRAAASERPLVLESLKLNPQNASAHSVYADICARFGPRDQAETHVQTALALAPNDPDILEAVAMVYENLGNRKRALKFMNNAFAKGFTWQEAVNDPEAQLLLKDPGLHRRRK